MLRTLGFFTGVGIAIAGLLVVLEPAELQRLQAETTSRVTQLLPQQADSPGWWEQWRRNASTGSRKPPPQGPSSGPPRDQGVAFDSTQRIVGRPGSGDATGAPTATGEQTEAVAAPAPAQEKAEPGVSVKPQSHLFWNPFRSEVAARGFADRLSTTTDVAVLVTEEGPASYRVGFSYRSDAERRALIERIETVTGLELE